MRALRIEPEYRDGPGRARPIDGEPDPVPDRQILRLAHAPDVAGFGFVLEQRAAVGVEHAHRPACGQTEGLVVRAVFLGLLRHQADVADVAHRRHVERAVALAVGDDLGVDAGIAAVRDHRVRVMQCAVRPPHLSRCADRRGHRRVDNDVARHVQVRDAPVGVDHREPRARRVDGLDVGLDLGAPRGRQRRDLRMDVADPVVGVDAEFLEHGGVFLEHVAVVHAHRVTEDDGVGDLHHRGLHMQREQHAAFARPGRFGLEERLEFTAAHDGGVDDLPFEHLQRLLQHVPRTVGFDELDPDAACPVDHARLLAREKVALAHVRDIGLRVGTPRPHRMRVRLRVSLDGRGDAAVGIAFAQHRVDRAAEDLRIPGPDVPRRVVARLLGIVRHGMALVLQFGDGGRQLRHGRTDVGQLDDVGFGLLDQRAEFGEIVAAPLTGREILRKRGQNPPGKRDVPRLDGNPGRPRERFEYGQEGVRRKQRRLIRQRVYDIRRAHVYPYA